MKKLIGMLVGVSVMCQSAFAVSTVSSHAIPGLVDEINTALANPDVTTIDATGDVTLTDANGAATFSAVGFEAYDGVLKLDADQGDDNADTWFIESEAADNDLSIVNHTSEMLKIDTSGNVTITGDLTLTGGDIIGDLGVTGGDITGANGNAIDVGEAVDGTITFSRDDAGTVTLTSADSDANAALTVSAGGTGALTVGDSGSTTAITSSDWAIGATGVATGFGDFTSDGTVQGAGLKSASAGITIISGAYTGVLNVVSTTLTFIVNGSVTNVLDADITTP